MSRRPLFPPVFAPNASHPMVDDFTLRAARLQARAQPPGVMPVYPVPLRDHPMWMGNNELGNSVNFAPDANNRQMVLKLNPWGEPTDWTVTLGITGDYEQLGIGNRFDVIAEIDAGVGGTTQRVEIDWLNGTTFTMPMNALTVTAVYTTEFDFEAPTDLRLSVTVGRASGGRVHAPTRSFEMFIGSGNFGSERVVIPAFAKNVTIYPIPGPLGRALDFFYQSSRFLFLTSTVASYVVGDFDGSQTITYMDPTVPVYGAPMPLPIPPFARFLQWTSLLPGSPNFAIAQFGLNL